MYKHKHEHMRYAHTYTHNPHMYLYFHLCDLHPTLCSNISLSVLTNLDTPSFTYLYCGVNGAGQIPDTPSTMLDIVLSTAIEHRQGKSIQIADLNTVNINEISPYG